MRLCLCFIAALFISIQGIASASVEISNPRAIMSGSIIIKPNRRPEFSARLSPDGKYILFPQQIDAIENTYTLYLQNIETAEEVKIPVVLLSGYDTVFTRFNFFNPTGDKLALVSMKKENNQNLTEVFIFDIASKNLIKTGINGHLTMAQFDFSGNNLVLSPNEGTVSIASLDDFKSGKTIMSGWVHSCSPKTPFAAVFVPPSRPMSIESLPMSIEELRNLRNTMPKAEFKLLNLKTNESFILPTHSDNSQLDDITSHWSSDGLYIFYMDLKDDSLGSPGIVTRVWDVNSNKEKATIAEALCLGPGPADNLMIMISTDNNSSGSNLRLYDIKTDTLSPIGTGSIKGVHAWSNRILYVETMEEGIGKLYVADIVESEDNKP